MELVRRMPREQVFSLQLIGEKIARATFSARRAKNVSEHRDDLRSFAIDKLEIASALIPHLPR
jgi:hypothetical protein